ncbi:alanine racemase [alpha proteobacterium U9-1i]|nr:alanine racemase [alpha proteobacterium U9-1i]
MTAATQDSETSPRGPDAPRLARLRVDASALGANWKTFQKLARGAETSAVVKADGYGLGAAMAARAFAQAGARVFFTATSSEALEVRAALGDGPQIFVLNGPSEADVTHYAGAKLIPVLNSLPQINIWNGRAPAALHIDTGMNRLGLAPNELAHAAVALKGAPLVLVMSHLACASDLKHELNARQRRRFVDAATLFPKAPLSLAATAGAQVGPDYHFDLIRPGIGLYGSAGLDTTGIALTTAAMVEAPILQVRDVPAGETFGYGATFTADKPMRTATVAIGYADGYLRSLSGRGYGVLAGAKRPILGRVSMDLVIIDVTHCAEAKPGAMVEFLGPNAMIDDVADRAGTASYELLTTLAGTVRRRGIVA